MPEPTCGTSRTVVEPGQKVGTCARRQWSSTGVPEVREHSADQVRGILRDVADRTGITSSAENRA